LIVTPVQERGGRKTGGEGQEGGGEVRSEALGAAAMAVKAALLLAAATWVCLSAAAAVSAFEAVPTVAFDERFSPLFGDGNLVRSSDDRSVRLLLDRRSGT
jgi:hypothetical protein